jgi:hypothetical protein
MSHYDIERMARTDLGRIFEGMDILHNVQKQIAYRYSDRMNRDEAQAHFDARAILSNAQNSLLEDAESLLPLIPVDEFGDGKPEEK